SAPCTFTVAPTTDAEPAAGGNSTVNVTTQSGCAWTATSNATWITVTAGATGTGNGTVTYSTTANTGTSARTGPLTIAGQTFTVNQSAPCTFTVAPTTDAEPAAGGNSTANVTTQSGCAWTATSNATWITVTAGATGTGSGTVTYSTAANTGTSA